MIELKKELIKSLINILSKGSVGKMKFRAWDKVSETMHKVEGIRFGINGARVISLAEMNRYNNNHTRWHTDIELLQSTGLFDKNGKEIFESEIVDVYTLEETIYLRGIVKKVKGGFYIEELYHSKVIPLTDFYFKSYTNTLEIEILGNKFEHPHLLGEG